MDGETVETVTGWASEPFEGGYAGLHDLTAREFTGAVTDGTAWLFVLNGRVVAVADGDIESFADAEGTAYAAPDPSLPLLFAMRERGGETRGRYYTNDTPLSEVDETLSAGNFTGYVALSENVLSGDYYVVYHGGRSLACAFVGSSRRTLTGDEAFARANDEVGIYEVCEVDVSVIDVPEAPAERSASDANGAEEADAEDGTAAAAATAAADPDAPDGPDSAPDDPTDDGGTDDAPADDRGGTGGVTIDPVGALDPDSDAEEPSDSDPDGPAAPAPDDPAPEATGDPGDATADPSPVEGASDGGAGGATDGDDRAADATSDRTPDVEGADDAEGSDESDESDAEGAGSGGDPGTAGRSGRRSYARRDGEPTDAVSGSDSDPFSAEEQWRETRSIPSLDPDDAGGGATDREPAATRPDATAPPDPDGADGSDTSDASDASDDGSEPAPDDATATDADEGSVGSAGVGPAALDRARTARDEAREELAAVRADLEESEADAERLREENERLRDRVNELRADLEAAREEAAALDRAPDAPAERTVPADRALAGTNLFVRYDSKGGATLEDARRTAATREEVNDNLRIELHTDFDAGSAVVDGRPFGEFLADSLEYEFVEWAVRDLIYEIRDTRNESALRGLFTALPSVDRAELHGTVDLVDEEGKRADERTFDVVLRDRMGTPLVVADVTDSRNPTTESMLDALVESASAVAERQPDLGAAFYVSASFFDPGALEAAADATGGGLLNRGKYESFVRLSRKQGFHLCLVEAREGEFHVTVPEL